MPNRRTIFWTGPALQALIEIVGYIKQDKPEAAHHFGNQIKRKITRLARFPYSGRIVPEFSVNNLREILIGDYRIIYRIVSDQSKVEILTVFHGSKSIKGMAPPKME